MKLLLSVIDLAWPAEAPFEPSCCEPVCTALESKVALPAPPPFAAAALPVEFQLSAL